MNLLRSPDLGSSEDPRRYDGVNNEPLRQLEANLTEYLMQRKAKLALTQRLAA